MLQGPKNQKSRLGVEKEESEESLGSVITPCTEQQTQAELWSWFLASVLLIRVSEIFEKNKRTLFCAWIPNPGPSLLWYLSGHLSLVFQKLAVPGSALLFSFSSAVRAPGSTFWCLVSKWPLPFAGFLPSHFDPCISMVSFPVFVGTCKGWLAAFPWALGTRTVLINCTPQAPGVPILAVDHQTPYF